MIQRDPPPARRARACSRIHGRAYGVAQYSRPDGPAPPLGHRDLNRDKGKPPVKGHKNIPSLDAITARLANTRALSIDGTPKPPEPEMIEDPKTPGVHVMKEEHPLQYSWTLYHDSQAKFPYTPSPTSVNPNGASMSTNTSANPTDPSLLERNSNYHLFKSPIKPMWEDPANASGGKWVLTMRNNPELLDRCWGWLCMALFMVSVHLSSI
ncbi:hypothetical protein HHX47_DHR4000831 [Lentinula edodes]|nr:hypothetical protein HHX47_DHR4000831 [Lentinula edodes]